MKFWSPWKKNQEVLSKSSAGYQKPETVELSEELFRNYQSARELWAVQAQEDEDFRNDKQWTTAEINALESANQAPIIINVIKPSVEQAKSMLTANNPRFTSTAREDSDVKTGKVFSDLMAYIWDKSDGNIHLKTVVDDYYVKGMGVLMAYYDPFGDYGKGEIKITNLNPFDLFIDPNAKDLFCRDAGHMIVSPIMTGEQIVDMYPDSEQLLEYADRVTEVTNIPGTSNDSLDRVDNPYDLTHQRFRVIDRYSKIKEIDYNVFNPENGRERIFNRTELQEFLMQPACVVFSEGEERYITEEEEVVQFIQLAEAGNGYFHFAMNPETGQPEIQPGQDNGQGIPGSEGAIQVVDMAFMVDKEVLIVNEIVQTKIQRTLCIGGVLYSESVLPLEDYPIVPFINGHTRTPYGISDVRTVRPLQKQINKIESLIIAHATNSTNVKWWVPKGAVDKREVEEKLNKAGAQMMEYDPELGVPIQANPIPLPNELYKNKADKIQEIERILGIYALQQGDSSNAPNTFKGTVALDEFGQRRIRSKRTDIEAGLNVLAKVIIQMIQKYYQEHKIFRLVQANNLPVKEFAINQPLYNDYRQVIGKVNDVTVGRYDVIVVSGSMLPSNRFALAEYYKELLQVGAIDQQEFLMKTEVADVEGVLERTGVINQQQRMIQELQEQVKNLSGDLQTLQRENIHLNKRVEVEKFKAGLEEPKQAVKKTQQLYDALMKEEYKVSQQSNKGNTNE